MPEVRLELGEPPPPSPVYASYVIAGEPQATLAAIEMIQSGGNAADAAAVLGLSMAVTLPSAVGLSGGGVCLVHQLGNSSAEFAQFIPENDAQNDLMLVRGLFALHAKHGSVPWAQVVAPAENQARFGHAVSQALARDLMEYGSKLSNDRAALDVFMTSQRQLLQAGDQFRQPQLASTLMNIRSNYQAAMRAFAAAENMGEPGKAPDGSQVRWKTVSSTPENGLIKYSYPGRSSTGEEHSGRENTEAAPGSSSFIVADAQGTVIGCLLSMGEPFGVGRMIPELGVLKSSPQQAGSVLESGAIDFFVDRSLRYAAYAGASTSPAVRSGISDIPAANHDARPGVNFARCNLKSGSSKPDCQLFADPMRHGYAAVITAGK